MGHYAARQADLTAATLDATCLFPEKPASLPAAFLLELGAVLELGMWERQGVRPFLAVDLPTFHEAAAQLATRANQGPEAFEGPDAAPLSRRVLRVWMENFAWDGPQLLGCDVLVGTVDENQFAAVLAEFLLEHHHDLSRLLPNMKETP